CPLIGCTQRNECISCCVHERHHILILLRKYVNTHVFYLILTEFFQRSFKVRKLATARTTTGKPECKQYYLASEIFQRSLPWFQILIQRKIRSIINFLFTQCPSICRNLFGVFP